MATLAALASAPARVPAATTPASPSPAARKRLLRHALLLVAAVVGMLALAPSRWPTPPGGLCSRQASGAYVSQPNATVWGQDVMIAFGSGFRESMGARRGHEGFWVSALVTGFVLTGLSINALVQPGAERTLHYYIVALYPLFTGIVEFARFNFDASRFGFLTASWHNVWEYALIAFLLLPEASAKKMWPKILAAVWILDAWIMFTPSQDGVLSGVFWAALPEQLTGICADWVLIGVFAYLYFGAKARPAWMATDEAGTFPSIAAELRGLYGWGLAASLCHMLEIVPLVFLLSGLTPRPYWPIAVLVSVTSPITFWLYTRKYAVAWNSAGMASFRAERQGVDARDRRWLLAACIALGLCTILGPPTVFPECATGQPSATGKPEMSLLGNLTSRVPLGWKTPKAAMATRAETAAAMAARSGGVGAPMPGLPAARASLHSCVSTRVVVGSTIVKAKPGNGEQLLGMLLPMTHPVRLEEGCNLFQWSYDKAGEVLRVTESWSNERTLLKHVYTSPTVRSIFGSPVFAGLLAGPPELVGPFPALLPCSEVDREQRDIHLNFQPITLNANVDELWAVVNGSWTSDASWVRGAKRVAGHIGGDVRVLELESGRNLTVMRTPSRSAVLPPTPQPEGGHRLVYHVLDGGFVGSLLEQYTGTVTLTPAATNPKAQTSFVYEIKVQPRSGVAADAAIAALNASFGDEWAAFLRSWVARSFQQDVTAPPAAAAAPAPASAEVNSTSCAGAGACLARVAEDSAEL